MTHLQTAGFATNSSVRMSQSVEYKHIMAQASNKGDIDLGTDVRFTANDPSCCARSDLGVS